MTFRFKPTSVEAPRPGLLTEMRQVAAKATELILKDAAR